LRLRCRWEGIPMLAKVNMISLRGERLTTRMFPAGSLGAGALFPSFGFSSSSWLIATFHLGGKHQCICMQPSIQYLMSQRQRQVLDHHCQASTETCSQFLSEQDCCMGGPSPSSSNNILDRSGQAYFAEGRGNRPHWSFLSWHLKLPFKSSVLIA
jgi:hypothetical protein